jgi:hypothetical protein
VEAHAALEVSQFGLAMKESSPTEDPGFKRTLRNLLTAPPKRQADMKKGQRKKRAQKAIRKK